MTTGWCTKSSTCSCTPKLKYRAIKEWSERGKKEDEQQQRPCVIRYWCAANITVHVQLFVNSIALCYFFRSNFLGVLIIVFAWLCVLQSMTPSLTWKQLIAPVSRIAQGMEEEKNNNDGIMYHMQSVATMNDTFMRPPSSVPFRSPHTCTDKPIHDT